MYLRITQFPLSIYLRTEKMFSLWGLKHRKMLPFKNSSPLAQQQNSELRSISIRKQQHLRQSIGKTQVTIKRNGEQQLRKMTVSIMFSPYQNTRHQVYRIVINIYTSLTYRRVWPTIGLAWNLQNKVILLADSYIDLKRVPRHWITGSDPVWGHPDPGPGVTRQLNVSADLVTGDLKKEAGSGPATRHSDIVGYESNG